jgi:flagellar hook-associated protein 3 FlgL
MKTTLSTSYRNMQSLLDQMSTKMANLNSQAASGLRVTKASDDPSAVQPILSTRAQMTQNTQYQSTMSTAADHYSIVDTQLSNVQNLLVQAKEIAVQAGNGTYTSTDLATLQGQITQVKAAMVDLGNAQVNGKYLFSGYKDDTQPFSGNPPTYSGDDNHQEIAIGPSQKVQTNVTGNEVFMGAGGGVNVFTILTNMESALGSGNASGATAELNNLNTAMDQVSKYQGQLANYAKTVDNAQTSMQDTQTALTSTLSHYQDVDITQTLTALTQQQTAYQAALSVTSQISKLSILNYMK